MTETNPERVEVEPALTPGEWASGAPSDNAVVRRGAWICRPPGFAAMVGLEGQAGVALPEEAAPSLVAIAQQVAGPDGGPLFTQSMLVGIRELVARVRKDAERVGPQHAAWDAIMEAERATAALASILPPE